MEIGDIRKIGKHLKEEISLHLNELQKDDHLGKGAGGDITHPIDKRAEDIVYEELRELGKPVTLISEECGLKDINGGGPNFLVDPIDGSRNAISGVPLFSTSMALIDGNTVGDITIGYVIDLISGDEFWALKWRGSYLNGLPVTTQTDSVFRVIAYEARTPRIDIPTIIPLISMFNRTRCFGSTALDMAFLASGRLSMFVVPSPSRCFDFAAGYLLVKEAGGIVTDINGEGIEHIEAGVKRSTPLLASANEDMHKRALEVL